MQGFMLEIKGYIPNSMLTNIYFPINNISNTQVCACNNAVNLFMRKLCDNVSNTFVHYRVA